MKKCKTCKYFNTFGTNNFYGICDFYEHLTDADSTCENFKEGRNENT